MLDGLSFLHFIGLSFLQEVMEKHIGMVSLKDIFFSPRYQSEPEGKAGTMGLLLPEGSRQVLTGFVKVPKSQEIVDYLKGLETGEESKQSGSQVQQQTRSNKQYLMPTCKLV